VAGKTAPDCTPTVWRPSTFWCYEIRDQATIIASALVSVLTSVYGSIAFYGRFILGRKRLGELGVDLNHLKKPVEVLATAFLIDKVIRLHKRKDEITVKTLWSDLPFDKDMDKDVDHLIDARIGKLMKDMELFCAEFQAQGKPLTLDTLAILFRAQVQADDTKVRKQPGGSAADDSGSTDFGNHSDSLSALSSNATLAVGPAVGPSKKSSAPLNEVVEHLQRHNTHSRTEQSHQERSRHTSPSAHTGKSLSSFVRSDYN
jgi:hypothetical protein